MSGSDARLSIARIVEQYYESLYRYAYRLSGSSADAEDLTQEAFIKAQTQIKQLRDPERVRPWLYSILRNAFLQKRRASGQQTVVSLEKIGDIASQGSLQETPEIGSEELQRALNDLPEGFRTPLILYYFEEMSYRDIAEQMDLPIGTVMSRLARAKGFLRERIEQASRSSQSPGEGSHGL